MPVRPRSIDEIWRMAALLHVPGHGVPEVLAQFRRILRPGALLAFSVAEEAGEGGEGVSYAPRPPI